jgi:hypothetical protein
MRRRRDSPAADAFRSVVTAQHDTQGAWRARRRSSRRWSRVCQRRRESQGRPNAGAVLADSIVNAKFNKANREYQEKQIALTAQAKLEQARADDERKTREAQAKIENYKSQAGAADARKAKSEQPTVQKPIVLPDGTVLSADGTQTVRAGVPKAPSTPQSVDQAINQIRLDPNRTDEVKDGLIAQIVKDHNTAHPEKAITKIVTNDKGELTAVTVNPSAVAAAGGKMALGAGGKVTKVAAPKTCRYKAEYAGRAVGGSARRAVMVTWITGSGHRSSGKPSSTKSAPPIRTGQNQPSLRPESEQFKPTRSPRCSKQRN